MRVPGRNSARKRGTSRVTYCGSRYSVTTVASRMSISNRSPWMNFTRSATPSFFAPAFASSIRSGCSSMHTARAEPRRRLDDQPSVAGAQVVDHVVGADVGELQHFVDDHPRRGHVGPGDVVLVLGTLRRDRNRGAERERKGDANETHPVSFVSSGNTACRPRTPATTMP